MEKIDVKFIQRGFMNPKNNAQVDCAMLAEKLNEVIDHINATRSTTESAANVK